MMYTDGFIPGLESIWRIGPRLQKEERTTLRTRKQKRKQSKPGFRQHLDIFQRVLINYIVDIIM